MQAVRLVIPGSYYDSYLYAGKLFLWKTDGSMLVASWDSLVDGLRVPDEHRFALFCAFQRSDFLYRDDAREVFRDPELRNLLERKFSDIGGVFWEVEKRELYQRGLQESDNPFPFPHAACTFYNHGVYVGGQSGIYVSGVEPKRGHWRNQLAERLWDVPALDLSASYSTLAIAAGNEGTFEYNLDGIGSFGTMGSRHYRAGQRDNPLYSGYASVVEWLSYSLYSSSYLGRGYLADFKLRRVSQEDGETQLLSRELQQVIVSEDISDLYLGHGSAIYTWGVQDKICFAYDDRIEIVRYVTRPKKGDHKFEHLGSVVLEDPLADSLVSAASGLFGFVLEIDDGLLVIDSAREFHWLPGEPVNWRVFPRSKNYENQLHVVYDDHLCIYSFNNDYLVEQQTKTVGTTYKPNRFSRGKSLSLFG